MIVEVEVTTIAKPVSSGGLKEDRSRSIDSASKALRSKPCRGVVLGHWLERQRATPRLPAMPSWLRTQERDYDASSLWWSLRPAIQAD